MSINKNRKLHVMFLLATTGLIFFSGISEYKAATAGKSNNTDDELEQRLANLIKECEEQERESLTYNPILARVARQRAYDMGRRGYFKHVNPDGIGPNYLVAESGYILPVSYAQGKTANNIESMTAGRATAEDAWNSFMNSGVHRDHILGLTDFYVEQIEYGVGHAFVADSQYKHYWVVIFAKPGENKKSSVATTATPSKTP